MSCGIYKITNILNGKIYIGCSKNIENRWKQHLRCNEGHAIHKAIETYGSENFSFEIIEECLPEELTIKEIYWIKYYNSYLQGYNMTTGGDGVCEVNKKSVHQYDLDGHYLQTFNSITEAEESLGLKYTGSNINSAYKNKDGRATALGFQWRYANDFPSNVDIPAIEKQVSKERKKIQQYDKQGNFIQEFENITDASNKTGIGRTSISNCLNNYSKSAGGYCWKKIE